MDFKGHQAKPFLYLGIFLVLWFVIPALFKNLLKDTLYEFHAPLWIAASTTRDLQTTANLRAQPKSRLIETLRDLSRENAVLRLERDQDSIDQTYIRRLEDLLELPSRPNYQYEVARVVRRDISAWWHRITIRKGRDFDIPEGAAVIFAGGVVGRVVEVHAFTSEVQLVSSPFFRMAARFQEDERPVTYSGRLHTQFSRPFGTVSDAPSDIEVSASNPSILVSSELGGVFPSGLTIGRVFRLSPGRDGLFQTGPVMLDERLLTLREVAILLPLTPGDGADLDWARDPDETEANP